MEEDKWDHVIRITIINDEDEGRKLEICFINNNEDDYENIIIMKTFYDDEEEADL